MIGPLRRRLERWSNPRALTRLYLKREIARYGFDIGDHTYGRIKLSIWEKKPVPLTIGRFCSLASSVELMLGGNHRADWVSTFPFPSFAENWPSAAGIGEHHRGRGPIVIGSDVWIGAGARIMSGVAIGHGAIVAADAVVARDIPPYALAGGNPVRVIRMRFPEDIVRRLLALRWWDFEEKALEPLVPLLLQPDIERFLAAAEAARPPYRQTG